MKTINGGGPWWANLLSIIGINGFIVLYLLGAIPGLPSPLLTTQAALVKHDEATQEQVKILRLICRGTWRDSELAQLECDR